MAFLFADVIFLICEKDTEESKDPIAKQSDKKFLSSTKGRKALHRCLTLRFRISESTQEMLHVHETLRSCETTPD